MVQIFDRSSALPLGPSDEVDGFRRLENESDPESNPESDHENDPESVNLFRFMENT